MLRLAITCRAHEDAGIWVSRQPEYPKYEDEGKMELRLFVATLAVLIPVAALLRAQPDSGSITRGIAGTWELVLVEPYHGAFPKGSLRGFPTTLILKISGQTLSGSARMGNWPGRAVISSGKIDGEHISFAMIGQLEYCTELAGGCAVPKFDCIGTTDGDKIELTITWGQPEPIKLNLKGKKVAN